MLSREFENVIILIKFRFKRNRNTSFKKNKSLQVIKNERVSGDLKTPNNRMFLNLMKMIVLNSESKISEIFDFRTLFLIL
jgi:hypothetical protein